MRNGRMGVIFSGLIAEITIIDQWIRVHWRVICTTFKLFNPEKTLELIILNLTTILSQAIYNNVFHIVQDN